MSEEVKVEEKGIVEALEFFEANKVIAKFIGKVMRDKKISTSDFQFVVELAVQFETIIKGFDGMGEAAKELKNLKKDELVALLLKGFEVGAAYEEGRKGL